MNTDSFLQCYFAKIQDPLAYEFLKNYSNSENEFLAQNCASALGAWHDEDTYNSAIERLKNEDDFEKMVDIFICYYRIITFSND